MFGGYSEVLPYIPQCETQDVPVLLIDDAEHDFVCAEVLPTTSTFGGFRAWPHADTDFILIAECSEISGPSPICTIPWEQHLLENLNTLCIRLLSADYQEFGSPKNVPSENTQLLVPDIMLDVHAAVNHFTLYDAEARGFVRPLCIAYVTTDKHKLIQLAKPLFKCLSDASAFIQHSNRRFCINGFQKLMLDLELTKTMLPSCDTLKDNCNNPETWLEVYNNLIESCIEDIRHILSVVQPLEVSQEMENLIDGFIQRLSRKIQLDNLTNERTPDSKPYKPKCLKLPIQQNFDKHLKNLFSISPGGVLLALYHLNVIHKHFKRKYVHISSCSRDSKAAQKDPSLYFGACLKINTGAENSEGWQCSIGISQSLQLYDICDSRYFSSLDPGFFALVSEFIKSQNVSRSETQCSGPENSETIHERGVKLTSVSLSNAHAPSSDQFTHISSDTSPESTANNPSACSRHIVMLGQIWDVIDHLSSEIPEVESITLEILRLVNQTESIIYSLLSRNPVIILYSTGEELLAKIFIRVLAIMVPRKSNEQVFVEHNRSKALRLQDLQRIAAVSFCIPCQIADVIPAEAMSSIAVLNLSDATYSGPKYTGCLLQGLNDSVKRLSFKDAVILFLISILGEVELQVKFWKEVVLCSAESSVSTMYLLQRGFTRCDIKVIEKLSKLCTPPCQ